MHPFATTTLGVDVDAVGEAGLLLDHTLLPDLSLLPLRSSER
jgi:hypothetical protein